MMLWHTWVYSVSTAYSGSIALTQPILSLGRAHPVESRMRENRKYGSGREEAGDCLLTFIGKVSSPAGASAEANAAATYPRWQKGSSSLRTRRAPTYERQPGKGRCS